MKSANGHWPRVVIGLAVLGGLLTVAAVPPRQPEKASDLFETKTVWTVNLKFTAAQWEAMEPKGGQNGMFGRGPGGPGGMPGASMMLAPGFMSGDANKDGKLSSEEFKALGEKWFTDWDKQKA